MRSLMIFGVAAATVVSGCDEVCVPSTDGVQVREAETNGMLINGMLINGMLINGAKLTSPDQPTSYIQMTEFSLKGKDIAASWVVGSEWFVTTTDGVTRSGLQLDKAKLVFEVFDQEVLSEFNARIRDVTQLAPGSDVWLYDVDVKHHGPWAPLCVDAQGEPTEAILLDQVWTTTGAQMAQPPSGSLTFACRGAALAKCVEYGYKPWASANGVSLADAHQACTRMLRADYCGDGVPHTVNGTHVHVLDQLGVQGVDPNVQYVVEAEWGPNGAVCLNTGNRRHPELALGCDIPACGESFASGGLIQSGKIVQGP